MQTKDENGKNEVKNNGDDDGGDGLVSTASTAVYEYLKGTTELQIGSPYYVAPEITKGEKHGQEADLFSFGIVLLECAASYLAKGYLLRDYREQRAGRGRDFSAVETAFGGSQAPSAREASKLVADGEEKVVVGWEGGWGVEIERRRERLRHKARERERETDREREREREREKERKKERTTRSLAQPATQTPTPQDGGQPSPLQSTFTGQNWSSSLRGAGTMIQKRAQKHPRP